MYTPQLTLLYNFVILHYTQIKYFRIHVLHPSMSKNPAETIPIQPMWPIAVVNPPHLAVNYPTLRPWWSTKLWNILHTGYIHKYFLWLGSVKFNFSSGIWHEEPWILKLWSLQKLYWWRMSVCVHCQTLRRLSSWSLPEGIRRHTWSLVDVWHPAKAPTFTTRKIGDSNYLNYNVVWTMYPTSSTPTFNLTFT